MLNAHISETTVKAELLIEFERHTGLGSTYAARLLGYAYSTYAQYRNGRRELQPYTVRHIQALMLLPTGALDKLIKDHVYGTKGQA